MLDESIPEPSPRGTETRRAQDYAEAIVQTVRQPLLVLDASCIVRSANPAFFRTFRTTPDQTLGASIFDLGNGQWDIPALRKLLEDLLPVGREVEGFEVEHAFPKIGSKSMVLNARRLERAAGEEAMILIAIEDVTRQREAERELDANTRELRRSNEELQRFAYVASHDLQEPLRTLSSYSQLLARRYEGRLDERADTYIGFMTDASTRMQHLIRDLLAYSRVQTGEVRLEATDLNASVRDVWRRLETLALETRAELVVGALPTLIVDARRIEQVFQNLLTNALRYRGSEPPRLSVTARQTDGEWRFAVEDNGIGVEPEYHARIFELFQRLHPRGATEGTGIGLPLCRRIVERHGGRIWIESTPGRGSTLFFTLPSGTEGTP